MNSALHTVTEPPTPDRILPLRPFPLLRWGLAGLKSGLLVEQRGASDGGPRGSGEEDVEPGEEGVEPGEEGVEWHLVSDPGRIQALAEALDIRVRAGLWGVKEPSG